MELDPVREQLASLLSNFGGRAAGAWHLDGDRLVRVAFVPAADLAAEVARGFEASTQSVDLALVDLGIVRVVTTGRVVVSVAVDLPPEVGSGRWLRAFGADRSVAVPIVDDRGRVGGVVSIALGRQPEAEVVEAAIQRFDWA